MRISDWSSDVCSSDLIACSNSIPVTRMPGQRGASICVSNSGVTRSSRIADSDISRRSLQEFKTGLCADGGGIAMRDRRSAAVDRSEERRVGQECVYVLISVVAVSLKKKNIIKH